MFRSHSDTPEVSTEQAAGTAAADPALRDQVDPDPVVEEAVQRLRSHVSSLEARDEWGRLLAWRQVARIALGPLIADLRDSQTAARLADALADHAVPAPSHPTEVTSQHAGLGWPE
jgi:hypothetical protein